jgi:hypothetical protein
MPTLGFDMHPQECRLPPRGLEQPQDSPRQPGYGANRAAESDALCPGSIHVDTNLAKLIEAWPTLLEPIRRAILALVASAE